MELYIIPHQVTFEVPLSVRIQQQENKPNFYKSKRKNIIEVFLKLNIII